MKAWKKGAGFLLALVWMLLLAGVGAAEEPDATALTLGEWTEVDLGGSESQWFSFVPDRTSAYVFESTNGDDPDPRATLYVYDGELVQLSSGDDETGMDFSIEQLLEAGEKYFLKVGAYNPEDGAFQIRVSKITFSASAVGKIDRRVEYGEKVTLEVMATADEGEISYQWYENDDEEIPGATGNQYVIESFKQRSTEYHCEVSNNGISKYIWFTVSFDNHIKAEADPKPGDGEWTAIVPVRDGEPAELKVKASCDHGMLRYVWYNDDWEEIPGSSNAPTCTVTDYEPDSTTYFYCDVYDEYDNFVEVWFAVSSDNHLVAKAKGGRTQKIEVYRDGILEVEASCSFGGLNYQWYLPDEDDEGEEILTPLTGETSSTLKLEKVEKVQEYCCVVKDEYEHEKKVYFMVKLDNHFTAKAYHGTDYNVAPGTDLTLRVIGDCLEGDLHYSWETYIEEEDDFEQVGTGETLVLRDLRNSPSELSCYVTDDFGNSTRIYFSIQISRAAQAATPTQIYLNYNETATMAVERLADSEYPAEDLHYRWEYRYADQNWFSAVGTEAASHSSYTTWGLRRDKVFRCAVSVSVYDEDYDEWYDEAIDYVYFYVYVDPLTATPSDLSVSMEPEIWEQVVFYGAGEAEASKDVAELTLTNYDALKKKKLSGAPAWTAEKTAGTAELTMDTTASTAKLSVGSFPTKSEEARYALKCAWGKGEPWKHSLIINYVDLSGDPPKGIEAAFGENLWMVKAGDDGDPIVPEQIFRFADGWTPPIQTAVSVSLESDTVRWGTDLEKDAEGTTVAKNPGIYPLTVVMSFGNVKLTKDYVLYATRADGTLPISAYQASEGDTLVIPTGTALIQENAFAGTTAEVLVLPKDCKIIESGAFAGAENLREIVLPADCSGINAEAFAGCANVKIVVALTEAAKAFAEAAFDPELIFMD